MSGMFAKGGTLSVWFQRFKWMAIASIAGDIAFVGGAGYSMNNYPSARLFIGELSPQLQDAYYMLVDRYGGGKDDVLDKRDKDVEQAAQQYLQARNAAQLTRQLWYGEEPPPAPVQRRQQGGLGNLVANLSGRST